MDVTGGIASLDAVVELISVRFDRVGPCCRAGAYLRGLLAGLERKNGWTLAEHVGAVPPDGMQRLLRTAEWDVDGVLDELRGYVLDQLDDTSGMWIVDDTGFIKKGVRSAGVQRQYTGISGKIDNCQLGVFLTYCSSRGRALVDRELHLPTSWTEDADRCAKAGVPAEAKFATKPQLALHMLARAHDAGVLHGWVTADQAFGRNRTFRSWLTARAVPFVLATRSDDALTCPDGRRHEAKALAALAGALEWRSAGPGAHGERLYDWAVLVLHATAKADGLPDEWGHWLLIRRQIDPEAGKDPELAFYRCAGPAATPVPERIRVAAARSAIEECFQAAKNEAGIDHYQVRGYRAWYAHISLAMLAAAYLAATRAQEAENGNLEPVAAG